MSDYPTYEEREIGLKKPAFLVKLEYDREYRAYTVSFIPAIVHKGRPWIVCKPEFEGLVISGYTSVEYSEQGFHACEPYIEEYGHVRLHEAERAVKTLKTVERRLKALEEKRGYAQTFAEYITRVMEALNIKQAVFPSDYGDYIVCGIRDTRLKIESLQYKIQKKGGEEIVKL